MNNAEYIVKLFKENFSCYKEKNIYLYGLSSSTKAIAENCDEFNICGLLDGVKTSGNLYGKDICDINDIISDKSAIIVIIARMGTTRIIYRRINQICRDNSVMLFDVYGNNLLKKNINEEINNSYFEINAESLKKEIDAHEVISFDIFDTLIMRKTLFPRDVFEIVKSQNPDLPFDFVSERISAEQELLASTNPTLEEIYLKISEKNNNYSVSELLNCEIETEKKVLIPRKEVVDLFYYAIKSGKTVYLVSDMYLNKEKLDEILSDLSIKGYTDIIVSCEHGCSKSDGLFLVLKNKLTSNNCLHIGDNEIADGSSATENGIDSFLIKSAYEMTEISTLNSVLEYVDSLNSRIHVGLLISEIFNSPFILYKSKGKLTVSDNMMLGKFIAPIITDFVLWLEKKMIDDCCKNLLLASRDGYLINKMFDYLNVKEKFNYCYFYISRAAALVSSITTVDDINDLMHPPYTGTPEQMLENRYLLDKNSIKKYDENEYSSIKEYVHSHAEDILNNSNNYRKSYLKYIEENNLDFSEKNAFFDFVSSGTAQLSLEKITQKQLFGYYFINVFDDNPQKQMLDIQAMGGKGLAFEISNNLYNKYIFLENILTSDKPTIKGFDKEGRPVYYNEYRTCEEIKNIMLIHDSILDYFKSYIDIFNKKEPVVFPGVSDTILGFADQNYININNDILKKMVLKDDFNGTVFESNTMI